jgi:riboflavin synthase
VFTGIIEELGCVSALEDHAGGVRISISASIVVDGTIDGDSISVNGVCLTVIDVRPDSFSADVSPETLNVTTIGRLKVGANVNLERAVTPSTRLGGHIIQGHVDSIGQFISAKQEGDFWTVSIGFQPDIAQYLIHKGSIAVEGISLTVAALNEESFDIAVIPKTWEMTNLSYLSSGDAVNLETDVIAKYVERMIQTRTSDPRIDMDTLKRTGFL